MAHNRHFILLRWGGFKRVCRGLSLGSEPVLRTQWLMALMSVPIQICVCVFALQWPCGLSPEQALRWPLVSNVFVKLLLPNTRAGKLSPLSQFISTSNWATIWLCYCCRHMLFFQAGVLLFLLNHRHKNILVPHCKGGTLPRLFTWTHCSLSWSYCKKAMSPVDNMRKELSKSNKIPYLDVRYNF